MENIILKMNYRGHCVNVKIGDTDRCLLIDVINEWYDEVEVNGVPVPKHPSFSYCFEKKSIELLDDNGLLEMFTRLGEKKEIDIWIGQATVPSKVLSLARQVRENSDKSLVVMSDAMPDVVPNAVPPYKPAVGFRGKLPIRRSDSICPQPMENEPIEIPPLSVEILPLSPQPNINAHNFVGSLHLSPRRSPKSTQTTSYQPLSQLTSSNPRYKMPKATAKKKGIYVPKSHKDTTVGEVSQRMTTRGLRLEYKIGGGDSDTDGSYEPSENEIDLIDEMEELTDLDVEDNLVISTLDCVDDGYDPYQQHEWIGDDGGYSSKLLNNCELYDSKKFGAIRLKPWMLFMDRDHFKDVLRDFCIQEGFYVVVDKADSKRYTGICATSNCDWRVHASVLPDGTTWAIKSIRNIDHGCGGVRTHNPMATALWGAKKLLEDIRANHDIPAKSLNQLLMDRYGLQMKSSTLYKMKDLAIREINGGHDESYKLLPAYCEMVKHTNPGSSATYAWSVIETPEKLLQFKSIFVSFYAQFNGLIAGCRSLIGVDGTHLKGNYGGVFLAAVALDGNNELFPVAVAVVESENKDSWSNFFWHLKEILKHSEREDWTIISDRQKGVEPALETIWPQASRRFCARHLCKNFKTEYPGILMHKLFWRVVNAYSEFSFKKALELVVQHGGKGCARWFLDLGSKEQWSKHKFDPKISSDENTSNFVESFNSTLGVHRCLPVLSLLEGVRRIAMVRHATRQQVADGWPIEGVCPNIQNRLRVLTKESRTCHVHLSGKGEFKVHDGQSCLPVSLNKRTCICGQWQISGIPCKHAIRAILFSNKVPADYVSDWFSVRRYKASYGLCIMPIPDIDQWQSFNVPTLEPPTLRRSIGRPSRNRKREPGEQRKGKRSISIKCKKCQCFGHNSKTCKGGLTAKEKEQMQGKVPKKRARIKGKLAESSPTTQFHSLNDLEEHAFLGNIEETQTGEPSQSNAMNEGRTIQR